MRKGFILACIASFILLYEDFNHLLVLLIVGGFEFEQAAQKAFGHSSFTGAILIGSIRLIPFVSLIACATCTKLLDSLKGRLSLCVSLLVAVGVIFSGYWSITSPLYTAEHASSTSAIAYIFVPITAYMFSFAAGASAYLLCKVYEVVIKGK